MCAPICAVLPIIILATIIISRIVTAPLGKVTTAVNSLGNLSIRKDDSIQRYAGSKNEVGKITDSVNSLTGTWQNIISTLSDCSDSLGKGSDAMMNAVAALTGSATDNTRTTEALSSGASTASMSLHSVTAGIDNITDIVRTSKTNNHQRISEAEQMIQSTDRMLESVAEKTEKTEKDIEEAVSYLNALTEINNNVKKIQILVLLPYPSMQPSPFSPDCLRQISIHQLPSPAVSRAFGHVCH